MFKWGNELKFSLVLLSELQPLGSAKSSRHVQSVFRLTLREIYIKLDLKCILKIPSKGSWNYFLISSLKPILYIYTHPGEMQSFYAIVLKMFSTQSLMKYQPDPQSFIFNPQSSWNAIFESVLITFIRPLFPSNISVLLCKKAARVIRENLQCMWLWLVTRNLSWRLK